MIELSNHCIINNNRKYTALNLEFVSNNDNSIIMSIRKIAGLISLLFRTVDVATVSSICGILCLNVVCLIVLRAAL